MKDVDIDTSRLESQLQLSLHCQVAANASPTDSMNLHHAPAWQFWSELKITPIALSCKGEEMLPSGRDILDRIVSGVQLYP